MLNLPIDRESACTRTRRMLGELWWRFELRPTAKRIADAFIGEHASGGAVGDVRRGRHVPAIVADRAGDERDARLLRLHPM